MKKLTIGLTLAALAVAGAAHAAHAAQTGGPDGGATVTRAEAQARAAQMFARLDANADGKLDAADNDARRNALFDRIDTDKNGQISRGEFAAMRGPEGGHPAGPGAGRGRGGVPAGLGGQRGAADANHDRALSQAEFTAATLQLFDRTDTNKDGRVTAAERQAFGAAMGRQRRGPGS